MDVPSERQVFLALGDVFIGDSTGNWKLKKVKSCVERNKTQDKVRTVLEQYDIEKICRVALDLLNKGMFKSAAQASTHLSEATNGSSACAVRETPSTRMVDTKPDIVSNTVDNGTQKKAADTPALPKGTHKGSVNSDTDARASIHAGEQTHPVSQVNSSSSTSKKCVSALSFQPASLPQPTQLRLLKQAQEVLEKSLYAFASRKFPDVLRAKEWDCPECVELNVWTSVLLSNRHSIPDQKLSILRKPLDETLRSTASIRHATVHREKHPITRVIDLLLDAESLLETLKDDATRRQLAHLRQNTQNIAQRVEHNRHLLKLRVTGVLEEFAAQRGRIERLEKVTINETLEDDKTYLAIASVASDEAVAVINADVTPVDDFDCPSKLEKYHDAKEFPGVRTDTN